jgi:hypothetical protein
MSLRLRFAIGTTSSSLRLRFTHKSIQLILTDSVAQELEGSSPHSQQPATDSYPEPVESNPHPQENLSKIRSNLILPPSPWSSEWSLSFGLSQQNLAKFFLLSDACHMPCPPHLPWIDLPNDIWG